MQKKINPLKSSSIGTLSLIILTKLLHEIRYVKLTKILQFFFNCSFNTKKSN